MKYKKTTLPNGLRIITVPSKSPSVTVLAMVEAGTNNESKSENGISHFLEHMMLKGTLRRPRSVDIAKELEELGAEHNAFTDHEYTGYWAKGSKKHFKKLLDIVADIYLNSTIPADDLEKERGVIIQEINMYEDNPQALAADEFVGLIYGGTPAGQRILGPKENILRFERKDFLDYMKKHYVAKNTLVVVAGDIEHKNVLKEVKVSFKNISNAKKPPKPVIKESQKSPAIKIHPKDTDQMHLLLGFRGYKATDKRIPALILLSTVLGDGVTSRLFQILRDEMGVCYYVRAIEDAHRDYGFLAIRTGVDRRRLVEVIDRIIKECQKFKEIPVSNEELERAKEYLIGHMYMGLETTDSQVDFFAFQEAIKHDMKTPEEIEKELRAVKPADILKVAQDVFKSEKLNLAIVGNVHNEEEIKKLLSF